MTKILPLLAVLMALPLGMARADDDCFVPMVDWQPRDAVVALAVEHGWTLRRIKIDDGCYEIKGSDAEGRPIKVTVHPGTLQIIKFKYEDLDRRSRDRARRQAPPDR